MQHTEVVCGKLKFYVVFRKHERGGHNSCIVTYERKVKLSQVSFLRHSGVMNITLLGNDRTKCDKTCTLTLECLEDNQRN